MKFWELKAIFSDERRTIERVLKRPAWAEYFQWYNDFAEHVRTQNRSVLDARIPDEICREALAESAKRFVVIDGQLTSYQSRRAEVGGKVMSAVEAFELFGGSEIEEVCEKGAYLIAK